MSTTPYTIRQMIIHGADAVVAAYTCAAERKLHQDFYYRDGKDRGFELCVSQGSATGPADPEHGDGGYWSHVSLFSRRGNYKPIDLDGIFGEPVRKRLTGVIAVPYKAIHELLLSRGWTDRGFAPDTHQWMASPPGVEMVSHLREYQAMKSSQLVGRLTPEQLDDLAHIVTQRQLALAA